MVLATCVFVAITYCTGDMQLVEEFSKHLYLVKHALIAAAPLPPGSEGGSPFAGVSDPTLQGHVRPRITC